MCEFMSWINRRDKNYFLTTDQLKTRRGQKLLKSIGYEDINGHGAIREYYRIDSGDGINKEYTDFSSPNNFPPEIVAAIKAGKFRGFGIATGLLTATAWEVYEEAIATTWKVYEEATDTAWEVYKEATDTARKTEQWEVYEEAIAPTWKVYEEATDIFWDLFTVEENRAEAWR